MLSGFLGILVLFLVKFWWSFDKNDAEEHMDFQCIFNASFHQLFFEPADIFNARNLKSSNFFLDNIILKCNFFIKYNFRDG